MADNIIFQPIRGTQAAINKMEILDGQVLFAYDSGRIYLDKDGARYLMSSAEAGGGSTGFLWADGDDTEIVKANMDEASNTYLIYLTALDEQSVPKIDSLILNSDGRFFRVTDANETYATGELIAVSGGGGGGGTVAVQDTYISYDTGTVDSGFTYIYGQSSFAKFTASSDVDSTVTLSFVITQAGQQIESFSERIDSGSTYNFDTARLPKGTDITITVRASSVNSIMGNNDSRTRRILDNISTVELGIAKNTSFNTTAIYQGEVGLQFIPAYNGLNQTLHVTIDDLYPLDLNADNRNKQYNSFKPTGSSTYTVVIPGQSHGAHKIELRVSTVISGTTLYSDPIVYNVAWREEGNSDAVIWFGDYEKTIINYNECIIPFMVYDPEKELNSAKAVVYIEKDGVALPVSPMEISYDASGWVKLDVTNVYEADYGVGKENIFTFTCGRTIRKVSIFVTRENERDLGLVNENSLILNLSSVGRSNNETSASRSSWTSGHHYTTFEDFNWYNNGWLNNDDGNGAYLSVANGGKAIVHLDTYTLSGSETNYSFEIRFRVRNIQEYSTLIRTIPYYYVLEDNESHTVADIEANHLTMKRDEDGNTIMDKSSPKVINSSAGVIFKYLNNEGYGFCIGTQEAYFHTSEGTANVRYKEDEIINLSFVVAKAGSTSSKLMSIYLNGILSGALNLESTNQFVMDNDQFEITSEFCDIDIFKLRIYNTELSMPDVIHNYISDIHSVELYDQNQLTDRTDGTILLYSKLLEYNKNYPDNPSMPYAVWEIIDNGNGFPDPNSGTHDAEDDRLPYYKGNDRYCKITFVNPSLENAYKNGLVNDSTYKKRSPSYVAIGAEINVQGTSSQAYPRRNFKTKMKSATKKESANGEDVIKHDDWGWFYIGGPYAEAWNTWITGKDAAGNDVDEETRLAARDSCAFKKWGMDNDNCSTAKFTWKIDYMESSGTYNTGFANLVGNSIYNYHPLSKLPDISTNGAGFRTSVYGFPVMVFHKHSTTADKALDEERADLAYEYIGRYNLNLDKGSNEYYGFELDDIHPFVEGEKAIADIAECWELRDNQGTWTSFKFPSAAERATGFGTLTSSGSLEVAKHFESRYNNEADQIEFCRGAETATSLGYKDVTKVKMADGSLRDLSTISAQNAFLREKMANLEELFLWLDSTDTTSVPQTDTGVELPEPKTFTNSVSYMVETVRENGADVVYFVDSEGEKLVRVDQVTEEDAQKFYVYMQNGENIMTRAIAPTGYTGTVRPKDDTLITYYTDCAGYRLKKYVQEFSQHLDLEYCLIYFILTELLLCYDSRGKNMMIASWGPEAENGAYIWYPIFYDIDTQLGLNNIGAVLWDYDTDATMQGTFSTANSVLWQNFFAGFRKQIEEKYRQLRKASRLTERTIEGAYLCDPSVFANSYAMKGVRPVIALGLDEWYKYIAPGKQVANWENGTDRRYGFHSASTGEKITDNSYVYTCQGDRKLSRELFIRNRLNYLDSWWLAGAYDSTSSGYKTEIMIRANANDIATSDKYLDESKIASDVAGYSRVHYPRKFYDAIPEFTITPFLAQYVTVFYDEDPLTPTIKYDGLNPVITNTTPSVANGYKAIHPYNEQLTYIPGGDYLSDLGDLSLKYPSHFKLSTGKRLTQLLIGSDAPNYANGIIGKESGTFDLNDGVNSTNKKGLLQKIILTGLTALSQGQDISGSAKLREFRALNTNIPSVNFAEGAPLDTVHLPRSVSIVNLVHAKNLTNIITSYPEVMVSDPDLEYKYVDADNYKGLYIENLTDWDKTITSFNTEDERERKVSKVSTLNLTDVNLGYDSYTLLENAVDIREKFRQNSYLAINYDNVNWSPYSLIESDVEYDNGVTQFYELTDHNNFIAYTDHTPEKWTSLKLNKKLYTKDTSAKMQQDMSIINNLDLLQIFIDDYDNATTVNSNHYRSTRGGETVTRPNITGNMHICNDASHQIRETDLTQKYAQYFPQLFITADYIQESNVTRYAYVQPNSGVVETIEALRSDSNTPLAPTKDPPTKAGYDFIGWSTDPAGENMFLPYVVDVNTGYGDYTDLEEHLNSFNFATSGVTVLTLYAQYEVHKNVIVIYNGSERVGAAIVDNGSTFVNPDYIYDYVNDQIDVTTGHIYVPYKDDSSLGLTQTYKFIGYSIDPNDTTSISVGKEVPSIVSNDMTIYSVFAESSVYEKELPESAYSIYRQSIDGQMLNTLVFKPDVNLAGKITIPVYGKVTDGNDIGTIVPIQRIANRTAQGENTESTALNDITHVYFAEGSQVTRIGYTAFRYWKNLRYVELPNYDMMIEQSAFQFTPKLFYEMGQADIDRFFNKVGIIRNYGFSALSIENQSKLNVATTHMADKWIKLPNVTTVGQRAFLNARFRGISFGSVEQRQDLNNYGTNVLDSAKATNSLLPQLIFYYVGQDADSDRDSILSRLSANSYSIYLLDGTDIDCQVGTIDII